MTIARDLHRARRTLFVFACPNPKCGARIPDIGHVQDCPHCGTYLFPVRPWSEAEEKRSRPDTLGRAA